MKRKIFLHIGPHKTATTLIQKSLFQNKDKLLSKGILYPEFGIPSGWGWGHHEFPEFLLRGSEAEYQRLMANIQEAQESVIILSSENFDRLSQSEVYKLFQSLNNKFEVRVIYTLREGSELLISTWQESIKHGAVDSWPAYFLTNFMRPFKSEVLNYCLVLDRYSEVFGKKNLHIIDYQTAVGQPEGIMGSFLNILGVASDWQISNEQVNRSLQYSLVEIIRYLNLSFSNDGFRTKHFVREAFLDFYQSEEVKARLKPLLGLLDNNFEELDMTNLFVLERMRNMFLDEYGDRIINKAKDQNANRKVIKLPSTKLYLSQKEMDILESVKKSITPKFKEISGQ